MTGAGCAGTSRDGYAISFGDNPKPQAFSVARRGGCFTAGLRVDWSQRAVKKMQSHSQAKSNGRSRLCWHST